MMPYLDLERSKIYITCIMIGKVEFSLRIPFQMYIRPVHQLITSAGWSVDVYLAQIKCLPKGTNHFFPEIVRFFIQNVCLKSLFKYLDISLMEKRIFSPANGQYWDPNGSFHRVNTWFGSSKYQLIYKLIQSTCALSYEVQSLSNEIKQNGLVW